MKRHIKNHCGCFSSPMRYKYPHRYTNQNAIHFDLRGERYGAIISILPIAICFNRGLSFDEELPNGQKTGVPEKSKDFLGRGDTIEVINNILLNTIIKEQYISITEFVSTSSKPITNFGNRWSLSPWRTIEKFLICVYICIEILY